MSNKEAIAILSAATDDNQLGAALCHLWDTRPAEMTSGKWSPTMGWFVTLEEWQAMQEQKELNA